MDEFNRLAHEATVHDFANLTKIVESWTEEQRARYDEVNPIRIWVVAGVSEEHAIAFSAN